MIDLDISTLSLYFGDDYVINDQIVLHQPTINDVVMYDEAKYFQMIYQICAIPSDLKSQLWDMGIDWCEIEDFDLFIGCTAIAMGYTLVTENVKHLSRLQGITIENWVQR